MSKVYMIIRWCPLIVWIFLASNILVQQNCQCRSPLMCICPEGNKFCCVLGDMNLLCVEGESSLITSEMWHRMAMHEPAGTPRMKAPEVKPHTTNMYQLFIGLFSHFTELVKETQWLVTSLTCGQDVWRWWMPWLERKWMKCQILRYKITSVFAWYVCQFVTV